MIHSWLIVDGNRLAGLAGLVDPKFLLRREGPDYSGIALGTLLGLIVAFNVIENSRSQGSWETIDFVVPWVNFLVIYALVYGAALLTSFFPALQASRVYPAEALRYE